MKSRQSHAIMRRFGLAVVLGAAFAARSAAEEMSGIFVMRADGSDVRKVISVEGCTDHGCALVA